MKKNNETKSETGNAILDKMLIMELITKDQLRTAEMQSRIDEIDLFDSLVKMGFIEQNTLFNIIAESSDPDAKKKIVKKKQNIKKDLSKFNIDYKIIQKIPAFFAITHNILPIEEQDDNKILIGTSDPYNVNVLDRLESYFEGYKVQMELYPIQELKDAVDKYYRGNYNINLLDVIEEIGTKQNENFDISDESSPIVKFVNILFEEAIRLGASDIHIEPDEYFVRVRLRIDGVLINQTVIHKNYWSSICVRLKVMAGMNIAESRKPQDGGISNFVQGRPIDYRVSCIPTVNGENFVIRILDRNRSITTLESLGFNKHNLDILELALKKPEGIIIVTGPTGSGKTTTLYSSIARINTIEKNIMTLEEPIEYRLPLIRQSEINHRSGFDFASGLRSILRQDPDIVFLGEIRDEETAQTALRASITGHQVFSTLHTNDAISAITRLIDMGIKSYMLSGSLTAIIAQRLVRKLCPFCKISTVLSEIEKEVFELDKTKEYNIYTSNHNGCSKCHHLGYSGRVVVSEVLFIDDEMNLVISSDPTIRSITEQAYKSGYFDMAHDAISKILDGITSWDEVQRVINVTKFINKLDKLNKINKVNETEVKVDDKSNILSKKNKKVVKISEKIDKILPMMVIEDLFA